DAGPAGRALLKPNHLSLGAGLSLGLVHDLVEALRGRGHGKDLLAAGGPFVFADDTVLVVIIHGQENIMVHGGLHKSQPLRPDPQKANRWLSSGEYTRPAGGDRPYSYSCHLRGFRINFDTKPGADAPG